jgi:hypothetical protein
MIVFKEDRKRFHREDADFSASFIKNRNNARNAVNM